MEDSRKVDELQMLVRRQEQTIKKLQNQIRERCQSYLLHASRHKRHTGKEQPNGSHEYLTSNSKESAIKIEERSAAKAQESEVESLSDSKTSSQVVIIEDEREKRKERLSISKQVEIREEYHLRQAEKEAQTAEIIESYKQRFAVLQRTKNDTTKELEKLQLENKQLKNYVLQLQRNLEKTTKAENKLKDKLKKMPEYETAINEIYIKLMTKIKGEEESDRLGMEDKHTNAKIQDILKWIAESMGKVDSILEGFAADEETKEVLNASHLNMQYESITKPFEPSTEQWSSVQKQGQEGITNSQIKFADDINQVSAFSAKKEQQYSIIRGLEDYNEELEKELSRVKQDYQKVKEEMSQSRILEESTLIKELNTLKQELEKSKLTASGVANTTKMSVDQQLQAPYYVEEELATDSNHEYVKRSFVRKKIVRRNLSATAYRVVSKSKEEVDSIIQGKIKNHTQKSVQKAKQAKNTREAKLQALKNSMKDVRVSEVSRQSDVSRQSGKQCEQQVKIIEVTTHTANQQVKTTKIYSQSGQQSLSFRRKN